MWRRTRGSCRGREALPGRAGAADRDERRGRHASADAFAVEAMEGFGVLRAAALAGVPAVEVRAISNEIGEPDRRRWRIAEAIETLSIAVPGLLARIEGSMV